MRVLTVGNMYPPHHMGGYELVWRSSVDHLRRFGHQVRVLTTTHKQPDVDSPVESDVHRELGWYWEDHEFPRISFRQRLSLERENEAILERNIEEFRPDVVGWWGMGGMSLSLIEQVRGRGLPAAGFVCEDWMLYGPRVDGWFRAFGRPFIGPVMTRLTGIPTRLRLNSVGPWVFPSEFVRRGAMKRWNLTDTTVVHQGVDHSLFRPAPAADWHWRLAYVGRIDHRKGLELAIRSLHHLPEAASLRIVGSGDGTYLEELKELCDETALRDRVEFVPQVPREDLPAYYAAADAVLFPVLWEEPWGLVPLEAMAIGRPVVASGRGGSAEYLEDGENCVLFEPDDGAKSLASSIHHLAQSASRRARLREGGFRTTHGMSEKNFDEAVEAALRKALAVSADNGRPREER